MKFKTTKKQITNFYNTIIKTGYCSISYLLHYQEPNAYTSGTYGWNTDIYFINNIAISTGYRPFGNISPNYDLVDKYEKQARDIVLDYTLSYEHRKELVNALLNDFINEVINNEK